ncbi:subtilisin-like protease SBT1.4 [Tripterygium wilfordii]|uniref:subtilisin-like protease SBT1.4 n=1 Tax=Tripterygium wilfordii TaxID=458696 RepID=UPI0018F7FFE4|nr:subtilisin-like protease SBT1.4 [Tripterygium wilfordii]
MTVSSVFSFTIFLFLSLASPTISDSSSDSLQTFIVHVARSHKPSLFSTHQQWYASIIHSLPPSSHPAKILYTYERAMNGFSAQLTNAQVAKLRHLPSILSVLPDKIRQLQITHTPKFLGLTDDYGLWKSSNHGDDVIIGVLDTGIWPEHPSFSDSGLSPVPDRWKGICETVPDFPASACNRKIIGARIFNKGLVSNLGRHIDVSERLNSPRDDNGHGSHCASTAAGSVVPNASFYEYAYGEAHGMAARARIAVYKVCWSTGCFDTDLLAAIDQAIADGVDVISLSVGADYANPYDQDPIAIGAFGAAEHGVVVSCAAGNSGPGPYTAVNTAPWILTVGASTIDREFPADAALGNGEILNGVSLYSGNPLPDFKLPLVYAGDCGSQFCYGRGQLDPLKVEGKIVLCDYGDARNDLENKVEKEDAVKLAGGLGMILALANGYGEILTASTYLIPTTMVGEIAGNKIREYIRSDENPTATIAFRGTVIGTSSPPAPKVAIFSSRGPNMITPEILTPDVIAPGVQILAAWTGDDGPSGFNIISGTSMACPHVSGIAGLLRNAYPSWSPAVVKSALMTTTFNVDNSEKNIIDLFTGEESTPFIHGAGHIDPNRALNPGLVYDLDSSDYIAFLCSIGYNETQISVFTREPAGSEVCVKKLANPGDLNYPSFSVVFESDWDKVRYKRIVKNVGSSAGAVYKVKVNAPENVDVRVSPKKLVFNAVNQALSYNIRFTSFKWASLKKSSASFGSIEWSDGVHKVRSPIAVRWSEGPKASI